MAVFVFIKSSSVDFKIPISMASDRMVLLVRICDRLPAGEYGDAGGRYGDAGDRSGPGVGGSRTSATT